MTQQIQRTPTRRLPPERSFWEHCDELQNRLIKAVAAVLVASAVSYYYVDQILAFLIAPIGKVIFTGPADAFIAEISCALLAGTVFAFPVILFQVWRFAASALHDNERKYILTLGPVSLVLFVVGILFAYYAAVPISVRFLLSFGNEWMVPMITLKHYMSFIGTMMIGLGVVFEMPLVMLFFNKIGILTTEFMIQKRRHAIVGVLIVSALITPPDVITQLILAVPLIVLYECGIFVSRYSQKRRAPQNESPYV